MATKVRQEQIKELLNMTKQVMEDDTVSREEFKQVVTALQQALKEVVAFAKQTKDTAQQEAKKLDELAKEIQKVSTKENQKMNEQVRKDVDKKLVKVINEVKKVVDNVKKERLDVRKMINQRAESDGNRLSTLLKERMNPFFSKLGERTASEEAILEEIKKLEEKIAQLEARPRTSGGGGGTNAAGVKFALGKIIKTETPQGTIDGNNTDFTVTQPIHTVFSLVLNGEAYTSGGYTISNKTITFNTAPPAAFSGKDFEIVYA